MPLSDRRPISEILLAVNDSSYSSAGHIATNMLVAPFAGKITHMGMQNLHSTASIGSTVTMALTVYNMLGSVTTSVQVASTALNTANIPACTGVMVPLPNEVFVNEMDGVQFTTSGGAQAAASNINCFCIFRRAGV